MQKSRAWAETLALSVIIPVSLCLAGYWSAWNPAIFLILFAAAAIAYFRVMFSRHKEFGAVFLLLTSLCGAMIQYAVLFGMKQISDAGFSGEGHPNGAAVLIVVLLAAEPVLINLLSLVIWFLKWLFSKE